MENGAISDAQIIASSEWHSSLAAVQGRLHFKATATKNGGWSALTNDVHQWLQIDLGSQYTKVTRVATQGRNGATQWVTKYNLQYSDDGVYFQYYKDVGGTVRKVKTISFPFTSIKLEQAISCDHISDFGSSKSSSLPF